MNLARHDSCGEPASLPGSRVVDHPGPDFSPGEIARIPLYENIIFLTFFAGLLFPGGRLINSNCQRPIHLFLPAYGKLHDNRPALFLQTFVIAIGLCIFFRTTLHALGVFPRALQIGHDAIGLQFREAEGEIFASGA